MDGEKESREDKVSCFDISPEKNQLWRKNLYYLENKGTRRRTQRTTRNPEKEKAKKQTPPPPLIQHIFKYKF